MSLDAAFWTALGQTIGVNILLSGDNAIVIALACLILPEGRRGKALLVGSAGAVVLRIILSIFLVEPMALPFVQVVVGLLLLCIGVRVIVPEVGPGATGQWSSVGAVIVADAVTSFDNVAALVAARGDLVPMVVGLAISIPLVVAGSRLILKILARYPLLVVAGGGLLGWIAGEMILGDPAFRPWIDANAHWLHVWVKPAGVVVVVMVGRALSARRTVEEPEDQANATTRDEAAALAIDDLAERKGES